MKLPFKRSQAATGRRRQSNIPARQTPTAFSYHSQRADEQLNTGRQVARSELAKRARLTQALRLHRVGSLLVAVVILVCLVSSLSLSTKARIVPLSVGGDQSFLHDSGTYEQAANDLLAGSIWNRNKITINASHIEQTLQTRFPELSAVSITLPLLAHRPVVYIQASAPVLILNSTNGSFVLDNGGKVLVRTDKIKDLPALSLPSVTDQSGLKPQLNHTALPRANVSFILMVIKQLAARGVSVSSMSLPPSSSELDVYPAGLPYFVKFNLQNDNAPQQAGTYLAVKAKLDSQHITPAHYIDVRVDGRAYYQ